MCETETATKATTIWMTFVPPFLCPPGDWQPELVVEPLPEPLFGGELGLPDGTFQVIGVRIQGMPESTLPIQGGPILVVPDYLVRAKKEVRGSLVFIVVEAEPREEEFDAPAIVEKS